jgi:hypothetical protein
MEEEIKNHPTFILAELVRDYSENKDTYDIEKLISLRENLALNLFYLADFYSDIRSYSEGADFKRKQAVAKAELDLVGEINPETGKKYTQNQLQAQARVNTEKFEKEMVDCNRKYYKVRLMVESTNQILNAISSRISNITK